MVNIARNSTRPVRIGRVTIGAGNPIAVQSMCATHTQDVEATVAQVDDLARAGADLVRIAIDSSRDAEALIRVFVEPQPLIARGADLGPKLRKRGYREP